MSGGREPNRDREGAGDGLVPRRDASPLAYFITYRTYGTWLPGDARETVDDSHNVPGTPRIPANAGREDSARERMRGFPVKLSGPQRLVVDRTIREVCGHCGWSLHELNVRTTHIHGVVTVPCSPEAVMNRWKSWATRRMVEAALVERGERLWARHGSTVYLWNKSQFEGACRSTRDEQEKVCQRGETRVIRIRVDDKGDE
jgi:REP element-mobilizing transposase RayT